MDSQGRPEEVGRAEEVIPVLAIDISKVGSILCCILIVILYRVKTHFIDAPSYTNVGYIEIRKQRQGDVELQLLCAHCVGFVGKKARK